MVKANTIPERVLRWLPYARAAELMWGLDPLLLLAICDRESNGGEALHPRGPTGKGDRDRGHGLMQIDVKYHPTFIDALGPDGVPLWQKPAFNFAYAAELLYTNIHLFDGTGCNPILPGVAAYNASAKRIREKLRPLTKPLPDERVIELLDPLTTASKQGEPGNYLSDVLRRRKSYVMT